jgi:hypothetical protein
MFSPWEEEKAFLRRKAEELARKGWAALTEYNLRNREYPQAADAGMTINALDREASESPKRQ